MKKTYLITIIFIIILIVFVSISRERKLGGTHTLVSKEIQIGAEAFFRFKNIQTGEEIEVATSTDNYRKQALKNPILPKMDGYKYIGGYERGIYATRVLNDWEYYKNGVDVASSTLVRVKEPKNVEKTILESDL